MWRSETQNRERAERRTVRIFVSSTWLDLGAERKAVEEVLQRFRETKFIGMEYFGSSDVDTRTASLDALDRCQLYVGIVGGRYGSGITEMEYARARARGLTCLIYFRAAASPSAAGDSAGELERFRAVLRQSHTVTEFHSADELAARLAADLHNWLFDSWLAAGFVEESVEGIVALPADYASRIQNFLVEYLGSERAPVPFGGRAGDIARLNAWLDAPEPPYALLAAPAGRGKSALVARWTSSLLALPGTMVIFMPVSIRFRTNLASVVFASLAARLANVFGEELPAMPDTTVEVWRALVTSYLRREPPGGGRIVVVLDGLDEAADWEAGADLFPADPPPGLRVMVTARFRAGDVDGRSWLEALGWGGRLASVLDLPCLTCEGVSDVLARMGAPLDRVAANTDVIGELFRLSEGDPLLVRLYADDLWSRGDRAASLSLADLRAIRPGLEGYFQRWWREQKTLWGKDTPLRQQAVQTLLNLLACALGPLTIEDLILAAPEECGLSTWTLEDALQPLARFVVGDGRTHGFVFSHPRLAVHFYEQLSAAERRSWEGRFVEWGQRTLAALKLGHAGPAAASRYLIQYFGAHLERSGAGSDELFALVDNAWRLAWLAYEGAYGGFLNDVRRARRALETADAEHLRRGEPLEHLGAAIQCALCMASVRSLASNIRPGLLQALVEKSLWTDAQALAFLRETPSDEHRAAGLAAIAGRLPETLLEQAVEMSQGQVSAQLVRRLAECGRGARALELIRQRSRDTEWLVEALSGAGPLLRVAEAEEALEIASRLPVPEHVAAVLAIARALTPARSEQLLRTELQTAIGETFHEGISRIAAALAPEAVWDVVQTAQYPSEEAEQLLVLSTVLEHIPETARKHALERLKAALGRYLSGSGWSVRQRQAVLANLVPYVDGPMRERLLMNFVKQRPSAELAARIRPYLRVEHVRALVRAGTDEADDRLDLWEVLSSAISREMWDELLDFILSGEVHAGALASLLPYLPEHAVQRAYQKAVEIEDESALRALAPRLTLEQLQGIPVEIDIPWRGNQALCAAVAGRYAQLGEWQHALELADAFDERLGQYERSRWDAVFVELCHALRGNSEALAAALDRTRKANDVPGVLDAIAGDLPPDLLHVALSAAQQVGDSQERDRFLLALGTALIQAGSGKRGIRLAYSSGLRLGEWDHWLRRIDPAPILRALREADDRIIQRKGLEGLLGSRGLELATGTDETISWETVELLLAQSLEIAQVARLMAGIEDPGRQAGAIEALAMNRTEEERAALVPLALNIFDPRFRADVLISLVGHDWVEWGAPHDWYRPPDWPAGLTTRIVRELIAFALCSEEEGGKRGICLGCACYLATSESVGIILAELVRFKEDQRARALRVVASKLTEENWFEAWSIARGIDAAYHRAEALSCLLPQAPASESASAVAEALAAAAGSMRDTAESGAFLRVCENIRDPAWPEAWAALPAVASGESRLHAMAALLERAPASARDAASREALEVARQAGEAKPETWLRIAAAATEPWRTAAWREGWNIALSSSYSYEAQFVESAPESILQEIAGEVIDRFFDSERHRMLAPALYSRLSDPMELMRKVEARAARLQQGPECWVLSFPREAALDWLALQEDDCTLAGVLAAGDWSTPEYSSEVIGARAADLAARISDPDAKAYLEAAQIRQNNVLKRRAPQTRLYDSEFADGPWKANTHRMPIASGELHGAARKTRAQLLSELISSLGWIQEMGGVQALEQTANAVEQVCQWWP
jgi:hypothetical protein